ncbi:MAG TPA: DUF4129 domain-containing protein [Candidatus Saccharimonadales bacterium]|nr:DUF4129 domain-containing protein [Candidatus Saccharimonadales bacterium]
MSIALQAARCLVEGTIFAAAVAALHPVLGGATTVAALAVALGLAGAALGLVAVLAETRNARPSGGLAALIVIAAAGWGVWSAPPGVEGVVLLGRAVGFGILGEVFLWRVLDVARGLIRWGAVRNAGAVATLVLGGVAVMPGPIDRGGIAACAILAITATSIGLALSRSAEELALAGRDARGDAGVATAPGAAVLLAAIAVAAGAATPPLTEALGRLGGAAGPYADRLLFTLLLPLGYVAAWLVAVFATLFGALRLGRIEPPPLILRMSAEEEAEALRQIEASRPFVVGAVELIVALIALMALLVLVERMTRERRSSLPEGTTLEREAVAGTGLVTLLAGLRPSRRVRPGPPRDDGTPAGALRLLYWRFLAETERRGIGWRAAAETPAEHFERAVRAEPRTLAAGPLVRAFETLRYGDAGPDAETVAAARAALSDLAVR